MSFSPTGFPSGLLKNGHLRRFPHPLSLRPFKGTCGTLKDLIPQDCLPDRQGKTAGALHLAIFEQPDEKRFFHQPANLLFIVVCLR